VPLNKSRRFVALDSWRGVCALLVAVHHWNLFSAWHFNSNHFLLHSWMFVDFFFVLSGFVITHAYVDELRSAFDLGIFMLRRFGRLWPLHASLLAAFVGIELLKYAAALLHVPLDTAPFQAATDHPSLAPNAILTNLLLIHSLGIHQSRTWNGPSWSISLELWTCLVFAIVCISSARRPSPLIVGGIALLAATCVFLLSPKYMEATVDYGFLRCIYGFFIGHLVYRVWEQHPNLSWRMGLFEIPAVLIAVAFVALVGSDAWSMAGPLIFAAVIYVFAYESGSLSGILKTTPFVFLGRWSYSIYMVHWFILNAVIIRVAMIFGKIAHRQVIHLFEFPDFDYSVSLLYIKNMWLMDLLCICYLLAVIALSAVTYNLIEQPARRFFNKMAVRLTAARTSRSMRLVREDGLK
jgi:peptidoglycan/LPS O-acetylase OafA/YrhL